jgi:UDPglucose--hexose-1-phosphate uridylyltransferase
MNRELSAKRAVKLTENTSLENLSAEEIILSFKEDESLINFIPDPVLKIDPRDNSIVLFNSARAKRPHDNKTISNSDFRDENLLCPVCEGNTTRILDLADLSQGFTFINKNLFPVFYPSSDWRTEEESNSVRPSGIHFLQWTSSLHDRDWHNMAMKDLMIVITRLAKLEKKLLFQSPGIMPDSSQWNNQKKTSGFISIIKNYGRQVGGSLQHGHQQVAFSNILSGQQYNNWKFLQDNHYPFSRHLLEKTPEKLIIKDYKFSILLVPYFMKRPYNCILIVKNTSRQFLSELNDEELFSICQAWSDVMNLYFKIMPEIGRDPAFNILVHNGPGAGLYIEFLPYTQETGGYEQLGLWVCQADPVSAAEYMRSNIS